MKAPLIIGIAGGSASGKTSLSHALVAQLHPAQVTLLPHDAYYRNMPGAGDPSRINYDHPDALDTELCSRHLRTLRGGGNIELPVYDFTSHRRTDRTLTIHPAAYILVEGILILHEAVLREQLDVSVFVDADPALRYARRLRRDMQERGRNEESVRLQWDRDVLPMHERFVAPSRINADIIIDGADISPEAVRLLAERIANMQPLG